MNTKDKVSKKKKESELNGVSVLWLMLALLVMFSQSWINFGVWVVYTILFITDEN